MSLRLCWGSLWAVAMFVSRRPAVGVEGGGVSDPLQASSGSKSKRMSRLISRLFVVVYIRCFCIHHIAHITIHIAGKLLLVFINHIGWAEFNKER